MLGEAVAQCKVDEARLEVEAERNIWLNKQLQQAEERARKSMMKHQQCNSQLQESQRSCETLRQENELLRQQLELEKESQQKLLTELESSRDNRTVLDSQHGTLLARSVSLLATHNSRLRRRYPRR